MNGASFSAPHTAKQWCEWRIVAVLLNVLMLLSGCGGSGSSSSSSSSTSSSSATSTLSITMFAPIVAEAASNETALVSFPTPQIAGAAGSFTITCSPMQPTVQSTLPLGTTTVNCQVTDNAGNHAAASSTIRVADTISPQLTMFSPQTIEATSSAGATVTIPTSVATDTASVPTLSCTPAIGPSTLPLGVTNVSCTATDGAGNTTIATSTITVVDTTPPALTMFASFSVQASNASGATVTIPAPVVSDTVSATPTVVCTPAVGSLLLPLGVTTVSCTATDAAGNHSSGTATITVNAPASAPTLTLNIGLKQLQFSWTAVSGATFYKLLGNPDGVSGFTQVGGNLTTTSTTVDIAVHRQNWAQALYLVQACNASGCTSSNTVNTVNGVLQAIGYFKASNTRVEQRFGYSLALSGDGNTLAIGATGESSKATGIGGDQTDTSMSNAGAVYVYTRVGGTWSPAPVYIKSSNTLNILGAQFFGASVSLSTDGNTLAIGAFGEPSSATGVGGSQTDHSMSNAGAVYIYKRSAGVWSGTPTYVKASNTKAEQHFGYAVALSGDATTLAVGASGEASNATGIGGSQTDTSMVGAGAVYVYTQSAGIWSPTPVYVKSSNTRAAQSFGTALALSSDGNTLAVGAFAERSNATGINGDQTNTLMPSSGAVYVYTRSAGAWTPSPTYVKASNTKTGQEFGYALALSGDGNTLAVGAWGESSKATGLNGDQTDTSQAQAGAAYVYVRNAGVWQPTPTYIKASNTRQPYMFGVTMALNSDGSTLAVGSNGEASNATGINGNQTDNSMPGSGAVYVYTQSAGTWSPTSVYVKATNTRSNMGFGGASFSSSPSTSIALSNDGATLAVDAPSEGSNATGIDGDQTNNSVTNAGAVYLY